MYHKIEVTFDIDANGIVSVSAKDLGTGKTQNITISAEGRLSEEEINKMVKEGEENSEADKKLRQTIEARNNLDSLVYQAEKMLKENGDKAPKDLKEEIEAAIKTAKSKISSDDLEALNSAKTEFEAKLHKLSELVYKQAGAAQQNNGKGGQKTGANTGNETSQGSNNSSSKKDDNVVDAEYEEGSDSK